MKYLVIDPGFMEGKERNPVFGTNIKKEAIRTADELGEGFVVVRQKTAEKGERIVYVSPYKKEIALSG